MAWYNRILDSAAQKRVEKLNPSQPSISGGNSYSSTEATFSYTKMYEELEIVNRGVNMIVDDTAEIPTVVSKQSPGLSVISGVQVKKLTKLLNHEPNLYQDINTFKRNLIIDYLLDGNIFIYFDGSYMYHMPAANMQIVSDKITYIKEFVYQGKDTYSPKEIIHIKENSLRDIYRGVSRLKPALRTMKLMLSMRNFQDNFFENGAVPGLIIKSPNTLSEKIKARMLAAWSQKYNPNTGGRRPLILDGGLEIDTISDVNFKDLDFQNSIADNEKIILKALGIPPVLLDSGNNANLAPNMRMYYLETVIPIVRKINFAFERYFGYILEEDTTEIVAMQPELQETANYYTTLVNTGILTPNEARDAIGYMPDKDPASDELRIPANIAGSAANPSEGGKPPKDPEEGAKPPKKE